MTLAKPFLKRTLLSSAIAVAAAGFANGAMADGITINIGGAISVVLMGTVDAGAGAGASAYAYGIGGGPLVGIGGSITNTGAITVTAPNYVMGADGLLHPTGESPAPNDGQVYVTDINAEGQLSNAGAISVVAQGGSHYPALLIDGDVLGAVINDPAGSISAVANASNTANATALLIVGDTTGVVSNNGTITATAVTNAHSSGAYANALSVIQTLSGTLTNSGLIEVFAKDLNTSVEAYGIRVSNMDLAATPALGVDSPSLLLNSGVIIVRAISTNGAANAYGINVASLGAGTTIKNTGVIYANGFGNANAGEAYGIQVGNGSGNVINEGLIIGGVNLVSSDVLLNNSGVIVTLAGKSSYVAGDYTQTSGGALAFVLADADNYGRVLINGAADFKAGGTIGVIIDPAHLLLEGDHFNDVITAGTLSATSFNVESSSQFLGLKAVIDGNTVDLTAHRFTTTEVLAGSGLVISPSLTALIDGVINEGSAGDYAGLAALLNTAPSQASVAKIIKQLEPEMHGVEATRVAAAGVAKALGSHLADTRGAASGDAFRDAAVWIKPFFGKAEQDADNGVNGYDVDSSGFLIGVDGAVSDVVRAGVAYAGANSNVDDSAGARMDINSMQFVAYGSYAISSNVVLDMNLGWASNEYTNHRFAGNAIALANYNGTQLSAAAELSSRYQLGDKMVFIPALAARFNQINIDAYSETGAGVFNLSPREAEENSVVLTAKAGFEWGVGKAGAVLANVGVSSNSSDTASVSSSLSANGPTYVVNGIEPDPVLISGGVGYRYVTSKSLAVTAAYDVEGSSSFMASTVSVKVKMPF